MLYSPGLLVYKSRGQDFSKGEVLSWREVRYISIQTSLFVKLAFTPMQFDASLSVEVKQHVYG